MLQCTIRLYDGEGYDSLHHIDIVNIGRGDATTGYYHVTEQVGEGAHMKRKVAKVSGWPRLEKSAAELLKEALRQLYPEE